MKHRNSCRVVINPIFGNAAIQKILNSRGSQLERRRKMEEIVSQIEKEFDDLDTLVLKPDNQHTQAVVVVPSAKLKRSSIRNRLKKGEDIVTSLQSQLSSLNSNQRAVVESRLMTKWEKLMHSGEVSKTVMSAYKCEI